MDEPVVGVVDCAVALNGMTLDISTTTQTEETTEKATRNTDHGTMKQQIHPTTNKHSFTFTTTQSPYHTHCTKASSFAPFNPTLIAAGVELTAQHCPLKVSDLNLNGTINHSSHIQHSTLKNTHMQPPSSLHPASTLTSSYSDTELVDSTPSSDSESSSELYANVDDAESFATTTLSQPNVDATTTTLHSTPSIPIPHTSAQRQLARKALLAVGNRASHILNNTANSSVVMRFGINTVSKLVPGSALQFGVNQWETYGDPLLTRIDDKIDSAVAAIEEATSGLQQAVRVQPTTSSSLQQDTHTLNDTHITDSFNNSSSPSALPSKAPLATTALDYPTGNLSSVYWERLKSKFVASVWYSKVDEILLQNSVLQTLNTKMIRPAEVFYNTVTEEYLLHETQNEFLIALKQRVGVAWDERLTPLAKGFYTTARAVSALVGAGRFVSGAMALGKAKVHSAIDDLLAQWDRVLGLADQTVDRWLPEREQCRLLQHRYTTRQRENIQHSTSSHDSEQSRNCPAIGQQSEFSDSEYYYSERSALVSGEVFTMDMDKKSRKTRTHEKTNGYIETSSSDAAFNSSTSTSNQYNAHSLLNSHAVNHVSSSATLPYSSDNKSPETDVNCSTHLSVTSNSLNTSKTGKKRSNQHLRQYDSNPVMDSESFATSEDDTAEMKLSSLSLHASQHGVGSRVLVSKFGKRLKQRIPEEFQSLPSMTLVQSNVCAWSVELKEALTEAAWFNRVDEILLQNALVKALANIVRPSQHFFNTALQLLQSTKILSNHHDSQENNINTTRSERVQSTFSSTNSNLQQDDVVVDGAVLQFFIVNLRAALGASWDERLVQPAKSFLQTAIETQERNTQSQDKPSI